MADLLLSLTGMLLIFVVDTIPGSESGNFPLDGCSTAEMDVLFLYFDGGDIYQRDRIQDMCDEFVEDLDNFPSNKTTPRVMFASVIDRFSANNPHVNVSSWHFLTSPESDPYGLNKQQVKKQLYTNLQESIELKVKFVKRLFSEMGDVRENVTHISVIFLDVNGFPFEEIRNVPHIVRQQDTDIMIFVAIFSDDFHTDKVLLNNTLLGTLYGHDLPKHVLTLAICNQCMEGWFPFDETENFKSLSCYRLVTSGFISWNDAENKCQRQYGGILGIIESRNEMNFLQNKLYSYVHEMEEYYDYYEDTHEFMAEIYIGLSKQTYNLASRYEWIIANPTVYRPLVINNWMPGYPSGGQNSGCVVWKFVWKDEENEAANLSRGVSGLTDGWVDIMCYTRNSFTSLCEAFVHRIDGNNFLRIKPASNESFRRALERGNYMTFEDNIVSVTGNIGNTDFLKLMKQNENGLFPVYDCGPDAGTRRYIAYVYVCDNIDHCSNKRDEIFCFLAPLLVYATENEEGNIQSCKGVYCCDGSCLPVQWVNDGEIDCTVCGYGSDNEDDESKVLNKYLIGNEICAFICNLDVCVDYSDLNDGYAVCKEPEGPLDETIGKLETADTCYNILGHRIWAPKCVYVRDKYMTMMGCRDVSHLQACADFECPEGYFKCPNTYCIPQHYVLDGTVDCPTGEEEQDDNIGSCTGNFACWNSKMCLHPDLVCNGHPDCPHRDDEVDCYVACPEGFSCVSGTIMVSDHKRSIPFTGADFSSTRARYLDMSGVDLSAWGSGLDSGLSNTVFIKWSNCKIINLLGMLGFFSRVVQELDVSYNLVQTLDGREMIPQSLTNIRHLNLSYNRNLVAVRYLHFAFLETLDVSYTGLSDVDESFLAGLPNLKNLNLRSTFITELHDKVLRYNLDLKVFDIRGLNIQNFHEDFFNGLTISQHLYTDSFELCCPQIRGHNIPHSTCEAPENTISSCLNLVGVNVQRVLLWVVAVLAILGNMMVIVYRVIWDRSVLRTGYGLFVTNLGISDFIMGVYLFIIAGADYYYRDIYVLYDKTWRESIVCRLAGFLATLSSETSTFFVFLITLDRFLVIKFPFGQIRFSKTSKTIVVLFSWITGFLLALTPVVFRFEIYSSNAMCLGLPLTTKRLYGWEFSFGVFIALNFCLCLVIAFGQRAIFQAMSENRINGAASSSCSRRAEDITVIKQLFLVALSNLLCWFPVGLMGLLSLGGYVISNDVYAWTTVIVLPINSAANPLLYTIPALMVKWEQFKFSKKKSQQNAA